MGVCFCSLYCDIHYTKVRYIKVWVYFDFSLNLGVGHNNEGEFHPEDQIEQQILEDEESEILDCENPAPYPPEHGLAIHR